ncbi:MAG: hypothetical protein ABIE68_00510 [bacterium]
MKYKNPAGAASIACYNMKNYEFLVIRRKIEPFIGQLAFPGGFLKQISDTK